jgi:cysteine desulfuration protein SufE
MSDSCSERQIALETEFKKLVDATSKYQYIIELGRKLQGSSNLEIITPEHLVHGCQSEVYLTSHLENDCIFFSFYSEALISSGLGALLLYIYQGQSPQVLLTCPPISLERIGIHLILSPGRSNGLSSIHLKMQREAVRHLTAYPAHH